jgi:predicted nucleic acid-binding protein
VSIYADTSFLVSLYVLDAHSPEASNYMQRAELPILLTPLNELEFVNALHLRIFRKDLKEGEAKSAIALFRKDMEAGILGLRSLSASTFERAKSIARRRTASSGTRTFDVLHVASALVLQANTFCTFDRNQRQLAKEEGLIVSM